MVEMPEYCVNKNAQPNGDHEVHREGCKFWPDLGNWIPLGTHPTCQRPVRIAKEIYPTANGCAFCSPECHTS